MNWRFLLLGLVLGSVNNFATGQPQLLSESTNRVGFVTNPPVIWESWAITRVYSNSPPTNLPPRLMTNAVYLRGQVRENTYTNRTFHSYQAGTLPYLIWTNFVAVTNGRNMQIWSERSHPEGWPKTPPVAIWNTNSVIWGMKGVTALSPCWDGEGSPGQVPLTVLTRRHVYTRGHGFGDDGFHPGHNGRKAWFLTRDNKLVEAKVEHSVVRVPMPSRRDYTILLLDRDLPETIETMPVTAPEDMQKCYPMSTQGPAPYPLFQTEQGGNVSTGVAPLTVNTWKGGDSGSPNLIPLPGQLVFVSGRSTSGPSREMQEDMDELCRRAKLDPAKYQLRWVDLGEITGQ
jgi:hypothetical protein